MPPTDYAPKLREWTQNWPFPCKCDLGVGEVCESCRLALDVLRAATQIETLLTVVGDTKKASVTLLRKCNEALIVQQKESAIPHVVDGEGVASLPQDA